MKNDTKTRIERGSWWLPEAPDNRLDGTLTYTPAAGLKLDLVGSLLALDEAPKAWQGFHVWGTTVSGKAITLFNAHQSTLQTHFPGSPTSTVEAARGIIGGHYRSQKDVAIHTLDAEFDYLTAWAGQTSISESYDPQNYSSHITVTPPASVSLGTHNEITVELVPLVIHNRSRHELTLQERCDLRLRSDRPRSFAEFESILSSFRILLTFASSEAARINRLVGRTEDKVAEVQGQPLWHEVEIVRHANSRLPKSDVRPETMLFTLRDLEPAPEKTFERFLEVEGRLKAVFELFFPTYFFELPPPQLFLNLVHAVDAFHQTVIGGQYETDEEYEHGLKKRLQKTISSECRIDFRQSLETKLKFLHHYSLRKRLRDIVTKFEALLVPYIGEIREFPDSVTEARNRLVHASVHRPAPDYVDLWKLAQQLGLILEVALLSEIGFDEPRVQTIIARSQRAQRVKAKIVKFED
jgi:hypothetical protein